LRHNRQHALGETPDEGRLTQLLTRCILLAVWFVAGTSSGRSQAVDTEFRNVEYARVGEVSLLLDLFIPLDGTGPYPVVVWLHGGGWYSGDKEGNPPRFLTGYGYAEAAINYRLSGVATFPAQIHDCKSAVRWLRAHAGEYNLDPDHIGVWGGSAGGHLAALMGTSAGVSELEGEVGGNLEHSSRVQAIVDWAGPTDFLREAEQALPCSTKDFDSPTSPESRLVGCAIRTCPEKTRAASPLTYVSSDDAPFVLIHGAADCTVPPAQSQLLFDSLSASDVEATLHFLPGVGHDGSGFTRLNPSVVAFLDRHLRPGSASAVTLGDVALCARIASGLLHTQGQEMVRLDVAPTGTPDGRVDLEDACALARIHAGLDASPRPASRPGN